MMPPAAAPAEAQRKSSSPRRRTAAAARWLEEFESKEDGGDAGELLGSRGATVCTTEEAVIADGSDRGVTALKAAPCTASDAARPRAVHALCGGHAGSRPIAAGFVAFSDMPLRSTGRVAAAAKIPFPGGRAPPRTVTRTKILPKNSSKWCFAGLPPPPRPMESVELTVHHHGDAIGVHMARNPEGATCIAVTIGGAADVALTSSGDELVSICRTSVTSPQHAGHIIAQNGMSDIPFSVRREAGIRVLRMHKESFDAVRGRDHGHDGERARHVRPGRQGGRVRGGGRPARGRHRRLRQWDHDRELQPRGAACSASVGPTRDRQHAGGVEATPGSGAVANSVGASVGRTHTSSLLRDSDEAWAAARATRRRRVEELEARSVEWRLEDETVERMPIEQLVRLGEELAEKQKRVMTAIDQKRVGLSASARSAWSRRRAPLRLRPSDVRRRARHVLVHSCRVPVTLRIRVRAPSRNARWTSVYIHGHARQLQDAQHCIFRTHEPAPWTKTYFLFFVFGLGDAVPRELRFCCGGRLGLGLAVPGSGARRRHHRAARHRRPGLRAARDRRPPPRRRPRRRSDRRRTRRRTAAFRPR